MVFFCFCFMLVTAPQHPPSLRSSFGGQGSALPFAGSLTGRVGQMLSNPLFIFWKMEDGGWRMEDGVAGATPYRRLSFAAFVSFARNSAFPLTHPKTSNPQ
jgi:hypothetical protein